jgi:hypothetical protein
VIKEDHMSVLHPRYVERPVVADAGGRPVQVIVDDETLSVEAIESVREEVAAYPVTTGPRTLFVVRAAGARLRLIHEHQGRRWTVEVLRSERPSLAPAA